jgi:catechol 2,3-dioxygenase-like lactoylglutathione lyase family enzyme
VRTIINIDVPSLADAIHFYHAALGLQLVRILDGDVAELAGASTALMLLEKPANSEATPDVGPVRRYARHWTPVHIDFVVDDITAAAARAISAGAAQETGCIEWLGSKCITFSDPFGHGFCLIQFSGDGYSGSA